MASSNNIVEEIQDSFLSCTICFQPFNRPKALPCLHTFCEGCLREYVTSRHEGTGQFPCPLCRQVILLPGSGVSGLPDNHFIIGLSDTVSPYSVLSDTVSPYSVQTADETLLGTETTPLLSGSKPQQSPETANKPIRRFGNFGTQPHENLQITGITASAFTDDIILADSRLNKVSIFSSAGQFRGCFYCDCSIRDVSVTRSGTLLLTVSKSENAIVREYSIDGKLIASFGSFYRHENPFGLTTNKRDQAIITGLRQDCVHVLTERRKPSLRFGSHGRGENHFSMPYYVTTNRQDEVIVSDTGNHRIKVHKADGTYIRQIGQQGSKPGQLFYPMGVCVDKFGNIYVADANNYRVQAFSADGHVLGFPVKDTYQYGVDVKPVAVIIPQNNVLLVALRGTKFCQVHSYFWDVDKYRPVERTPWYDAFLCCK